MEEGKTPPDATNYSVQAGQVTVPRTAPERRGIQPVVDLTIGGKPRAEVRVGEQVPLQVHAEVPSGAVDVVHVEWNLDEGDGYEERDFGDVGSIVNATIVHTYNTAGTYFPAVRVASHRTGGTQTSFALALNLGRARIIVKD